VFFFITGSLADQCVEEIAAPGSKTNKPEADGLDYTNIA